ncbi:hypothetical protein D9758_018090 [Tetrapyrgos nigripes]|uniref:Uncharacterized protein n=1 Tax=Tetrapyrgos nigripes TaxID=182062 RepID=A0A8H5BYF6_9AGAR|nr:hypothetical protein D9758_018090 [Tetrapyrgos nigripes]
MYFLLLASVQDALHTTIALRIRGAIAFKAPLWTLYTQRLLSESKEQSLSRLLSESIARVPTTSFKQEWASFVVSASKTLHTRTTKDLVTNTLRIWGAFLFESSKTLHTPASKNRSTIALRIRGATPPSSRQRPRRCTPPRVKIGQQLLSESEEQRLLRLASVQDAAHPRESNASFVSPASKTLHNPASKNRSTIALRIRGATPPSSRQRPRRCTPPRVKIASKTLYTHTTKNRSTIAPRIRGATPAEGSLRVQRVPATSFKQEWASFVVSASKTLHTRTTKDPVTNTLRIQCTSFVSPASKTLHTPATKNRSTVALRIRGAIAFEAAFWIQRATSAKTVPTLSVWASFVSPASKTLYTCTTKNRSTIAPRIRGAAPAKGSLCIQGESTPSINRKSTLLSHQRPRRYTHPHNQFHRKTALRIRGAAPAEGSLWTQRVPTPSFNPECTSFFSPASETLYTRTTKNRSTVALRIRGAIVFEVPLCTLQLKEYLHLQSNQVWASCVLPASKTLYTRMTENCSTIALRMRGAIALGLLSGSREYLLIQLIQNRLCCRTSVPDATTPHNQLRGKIAPRIRGAAPPKGSLCFQRESTPSINQKSTLSSHQRPRRYYTPQPISRKDCSTNSWSNSS